jgi:hypothetical protein
MGPIGDMDRQSLDNGQGKIPDLDSESTRTVPYWHSSTCTTEASYSLRGNLSDNHRRLAAFDHQETEVIVGLKRASVLLLKESKEFAPEAVNVSGAHEEIARA